MKVKCWYLLLIVFSILLTNCNRENKMPPNIILMVADDMGYGEISSYGGSLPCVYLPTIKS